MWMVLTLSLVCMPSFLVQIFSLRWYIIDGNVTNYIWIIHILQLSVFYRYLELFKVGLKARKSNFELIKFNQHQSDICMLRLFESFMESAPQLVLQLYIMMATGSWNPWTGISAIASVFSLGWGIAAYNKAMRNVRPEKKHLSWWGLILHSSWRIGTVSSRIISMVLFAVAFGPWLILVMFFHWLCMTLWVITQKTDFCTNWWEERLYNCIVGVIYCFCFFNLKEGRSRFRMTTFYFLTSLQNVSFVLAYYYCSSKPQVNHEISVILVFIGMLVGLSSMLLYYRFFHPSGAIKLYSSSHTAYSLATMEKGANGTCTSNCITLKTCRKANVNGSTLKFLSPIPSNHKNVSNMSVLSTCSNFNGISDLHRSHSLNCSSDDCVGLYTDSAGFSNIPKITVSSRCSANHCINVNYNFRTAVAFGMQSSKFHCSCLVLTSSYRDIPRYTNLTRCAGSLSLPNLKITDMSYDSIDCHSFEVNADNLLQNSVSFQSLPEKTSDSNNVSASKDCSVEISIGHSDIERSSESFNEYELGRLFESESDISTNKTGNAIEPYQPVIYDAHVMKMSVSY